MQISRVINRSVVQVFVVTLIVMTAYETVKQIFFGAFLTMWESHIVTIIFTSLVAAALSWRHSEQLKLILDSQKAIQLEEIQIRTRQAMMIASHHYLNNALNMLQLVQIEIDGKGTVDQPTLEQIREEMNKSQRELAEIGDIENLSQESISKFIKDRL